MSAGTQRDEFTDTTKSILAKRVGLHCSNPHCRQETYGPHDDPNKFSNVGVAAHITAAKKGGPRFNPKLTSRQRKSPENGIWLCQKCAKLIDGDPDEYPADLLRAWKTLAEHASRQALESGHRTCLGTEQHPEKQIAFSVESLEARIFRRHRGSGIVVLCPSDPAEGAFDIYCSGHFYLEGSRRVGLSDLTFIMKCRGEKRAVADMTSVFHYPQGRSGKSDYHNTLSLEPGMPYEVRLRGAVGTDEVFVVEECDEIWLATKVGLKDQNAWLVGRRAHQEWVMATQGV